MITTLWATLAIVGGTVHPVDGPPIEGGTVIIEGDRIVAVGKNLAVPAGAQVIDATGKVVTPGLFAPWTQLGLVEISGARETNDADGGGGAIRAAQRAVDSFNAGGTVIPVQRAHGVTTVLSAPEGGLIAGQAGVFDLVARDSPMSAAVVEPRAAMVAALGGDDKGSRGAKLLKLREALDDARAYAKDPKALEQNRFRRTEASRLDLEALVPVVRGEVPLAVGVGRAADILTVLRFAEEQRVRLILVGSVEAWQVAEALAAAKVPVILDPVENAPSNLERVHARGDGAAILAKAGVPVMLTTFGAHGVRKLRQWAGNAVRDGLPHDVALRAITATPAEVFGLKDRGVLAAGKVANVVVWSGDPFELSSRAEQVVVRGRVADPDHRQRALFRKYRQVPSHGLRRADP